MNHLRALADCGIGRTPCLAASRFCPEGRLLIKLESGNRSGSIKARTAWYLLDESVRAGRVKQGSTLVESTSGNLGLALADLGRQVGASTVCVVDPTVSEAKISKLVAAGAEVLFARLDEKFRDYPTARIAEVERLVKERGWIWLNQYATPAGMKAHEETTGPEIWTDTAGRIDCVVAAVGTGGTICGIGRYLKQVAPAIQVVAVEPVGSTIFGGHPGPFISAGSGLAGPSSLVKRFGNVIDFVAKVPDAMAASICNSFAQTEAFTVGITGAAAAAVARQIIIQHPDWSVVALAADGCENYADALKATDLVGPSYGEIAILPVPLIAGSMLST